MNNYIWRITSFDTLSHMVCIVMVRGKFDRDAL